QRVLEQGVERKVTPRGVFSRGAETYGARPPAVRVGVVGAERRHLEARAPLDDEDNPELHAHGHGTAKETLDDVRRRAGGDVVVERLPPAQPIPDAAAREVWRVPAGAQPPHR